MEDAIVISITPNYSSKDEFGYNRYYRGNVCVQEIKTGNTHVFVNGSMNGVENQKLKFGDKGTILWNKGPGYSLPFFNKIEES
jgi:hypothetical protein